MTTDNNYLYDQYIELLNQNVIAKHILVSTSMVFLMFDKEYRLIFCSENLKKYILVSDFSEIIGKPLKTLSDFIDDKEFCYRFYRNLKRVESGKHEYTVDDSIGWPNGITRLYRIINRRVEDNDGNFGGITCVMRDVTNMRMDEEERMMKDRLRLTHSPCFVWDENGSVVDSNDDVMTFFDLRPDWPADRYDQILQIIQPERQPNGRLTEDIRREFIREALERGFAQAEISLQKSDGTPVQCEVSGTRMSWGFNKRLFIFFRDISEIKAKEAEARKIEERNRKLRLQKEEAQVASEAKSKFLTSMSHEIRTPMNTIIGLLDLFRMDNLTDEQVRYIKDIKLTSEVLLQIISDILDFNKIEAGKLELLPVSFNLRKLYNDLISRHKFMAEAKRLAFSSGISGDIPQYLYGDEIRISQILSNLISNAIKYTREGYVNLYVHKAVKDGSDYIVFNVEDTGIGISDEYLPLLFKEFEQFDTRKNRGIPGTGLGLAIAKRLADLMDGALECASVYGKGSVFTLTLPLVEGDASDIDSYEDDYQIQAGPDAKALVVDDNPGNITVTIGMLARHGITPQTAETGAEAVEMVKSGRYDIVFMDHMMPDMDGVDATMRIRAMDGEYYRNLPIIALSANVVADAKALFFNAGMNDFIGKPIKGSELNRALHKWLPPDKILKNAAKAGVMCTPYSPLHESASASTPAPALAQAPGADSPPGGAPDYDALLEKLKRVENLSIIKGLSHLDGDARLYFELMWQFYLNAEEDVAALRNFAEGGRWNDFSIRIHSLKSVFASIGNQYMRDMASELEIAASRGEADRRPGSVGAFCAEMMSFREKLHKTGAMEYFIENTRKKPISRPELEKQLKLLRGACYIYKPKSAEQLADELLTVSYDPAAESALKNLHKLVHTFEYDEAVRLIDDLQPTL